MANIGAHSLILIEQARTEAIREFAERLKLNMERYDDEEFYATDEDIDSLVKEMEGENK